MLPLAALAALFGAAGGARASEVLYVTATAPGSCCTTYSYTQDASGNFSAATQTQIPTMGGQSAWMVQGPTGVTVPYVWLTNSYVDTEQFTIAGVPVGNYGGGCDQCQSVEDASGDVFFRQANTNRLYEVSAAGTETEISATSGNGLTIGPDGNLYSAQYSSQNGDYIEEFSPTGTELGVYATYSGSTPFELAFDGEGDLFGLANNTIVEWAAGGGSQTTLVTGLPGTLGGGRSQDPNSFAIDSEGDIFLSQGYGSLYEITPSGSVSTLVSANAANSFEMYSVAVLDVNTTPEPSTGLLFLSCGSGLIWASRRLRKHVK
jgi:hypothetical protein